MNDLSLHGLINKTPHIWWPIGAKMMAAFTDNKYMMNTQVVNVTDMLTCTRGSTGLAQDSNGRLQSFGVDELRITDKGLLVEETRTNYEPNSVDLSGGYKNNVIVTANSGSAPDGSNEANTFVYSASGQRNGFVATVVPNTSYTYSIFVKDSGSGGSVRIGVGGAASWAGGVAPLMDYNFTTQQVIMHAGVVSAGVEPYVDGWNRIWFSSLTGTSTPAAATLVIFSLSANTYYAWGMMWEEGSFPTSFIKTNGVATVRAGDHVYFSNTSWLTQGIGTVLLSTNGILPFSGFNRLLSLSDSSNGNSYMQFYRASVNTYARSKNNNIEQFHFSVGTGDRYALAWNTDDFAGVSEGSTVKTDVSGTPPFMDLVDISSELGTRITSGFVRSLTYWDDRKDNISMKGLVG